MMIHPREINPDLEISAFCSQRKGSLLFVKSSYKNFTERMYKHDVQGVIHYFATFGKRSVLNPICNMT